MRSSHCILTIAVVLLGGTVAPTMAQCPAVTDVSPNTIGRTINPASTYWNLNGDVADGDQIVVDTAGVNLTFEFDVSGGVTPGAIPVVVPAAPNRDAVRQALIDAVAAEPTSPCVVSSDFSDELPQYMAVVWKGEADGYGATNSNPVDANGAIQVRNFTHYGHARSYILLTGTDLDSVTSVTLESTTTADVLAGTILRKPGDGLELGFRVTVVPDNVDPTTEVPALGTYDVVLDSSCGSTVTIPAGVTIVENLINDSTFSMHFLGNTNLNGCEAYQSYDVWPGPLWEHDNIPGTPISGWDVRDKASLYIEGCQRNDPWDNIDDHIWGSISSNQTGAHDFWQVIPVNYTEDTTLTLSGLLGGGTSAQVSYGVEVKDQSNALIFQSGPYSDSDWFNPSPGNSFWGEFSATGDAPAGTTELKVRFYLNIFSPFNGAALHVDDLLLFEGQLCASPPSITSVTPGYGLRDDAAAVITVNGTGFVDGETTVTLSQGSTELTPDSMSVISGSQLMATFDLTGVDRDYWSVSVENPGCPPALLADAFIVVLAGPGLTNGSFELPEDTAHEGCFYGTRSDIPATDWTSIHVHPHGGGSHERDDLTVPPTPTCPPPDGFHWNSTLGPYDSYAGKRLLTQTVTVTPGTYTLSGFFAATGPNNVSISLRDGGYLDGAVATLPVLASGDRDWTFAYVTGTVASNLLTAEWETDLDAVGAKMAHADDLMLEECTAPVTVLTISETTAASEGTLPVTITGSGFSGATPAVYLVREGTTLTATNVVASNDTTLTCDFDMTDAGFGYLNLVVGNNGCYATLYQAMFTASPVILNPEFEDPTILDGQIPPMPADPCLGAVDGTADFWEVTDLTKFRRDDTVLADLLTCPNPNAAGGHYGTLSTDQAEAVQAWQVIKVTPGRNYLVGAWFAGGGDGSAIIRLFDGLDPFTGTEIASTTVMTTAGAVQYDWTLGTVTGRPTQEFMTIVWELAATGAGPASSHADGFYTDSPCNAPFADTDLDGDVDQKDFAFLQLCYTGSEMLLPPDSPEYCECLDVDGPDGDIDNGDVTIFQQCASGPDVPADPECPN